MDHRNTDEALCTSSDFEYLMSDLNPSGPFQEQADLYIIPNVADSTVQTVVPVEDVGHEVQPIRGISQSPTGQIPCRENFPGLLEFEVLLDNYSCTSNKRTWVYSVQLNKVFIDMNKTLLLQFRINGNFPSTGLWVRALPVFSSDDLVGTPVQRCGIHELPEDTMRNAHTGSICNCASYKWTRHVVQSTHSHAQYNYNPVSDRHSVMVPLDNPQPGTDAVSVGYFFTCKTSCSSIRGMNRKPIDIIFTLETDQCEVLGRYVLPVKICSCPKRDKDKEEAASKDIVTAGKRRMSAAEREGPLNEKKIKMELNIPIKSVERRESLNSLSPTPNDQMAQLMRVHEELMAKHDEVVKRLEGLENKHDEVVKRLEGSENKHHDEVVKRLGGLENKFEAFMQLFMQWVQIPHPTMHDQAQ